MEHEEIIAKDFVEADAQPMKRNGAVVVVTAPTRAVSV